MVSDLKVKNRIWYFREQRELTQTALANALGVRAATINEIENEKKIPSLVTAYRIAHFFDTNIEDVFEFEKIEVGEERKNGKVQ